MSPGHKGPVPRGAHTLPWAQWPCLGWGGLEGPAGEGFPAEEPKPAHLEAAAVGTAVGALPHTGNRRDLVVALTGAGQTLPIPRAPQCLRWEAGSATSPRPPESPAAIAMSLGVGSGSGTPEDGRVKHTLAALPCLPSPSSSSRWGKY